MSDNKTHQKKKWVPPANGAAASVDNGVFDKINAILKDDSTDQISEFFAKGFGNQAISSWSYYAQVNDHKKFTSSTITITKLLSLLSGNHEFHENGVQIIKEILTSYIKTIYRGLTSMRASLTNPVLRLINEIVIFRNGALLDDFVALFDFSLPVLPKLLNPTKTELSDVEVTKEKEFLSIRYCMIRLLLNIIKHSAPFLRKEFLSNNHKLLVNWFKYICVIDSNSLITLTLTTWDEKIIKEQSFKKATKIKVFNDWNITKLIPIYYTKDKELKSMFDKFIISIATDTKYGLKFNDDETWFLNNTSNGTISVNGKSFKTHNKLLYSLITSMKPWDDDLQLNTTVEILKHTPELIPPFVNYLASRGLHDPKLSSYWLGQTLLLSKLINTGIPTDISDEANTTAPSVEVISELIVPSVLNRAVLSRCVTSDSFMIRHLSAQLIVTSLQKLEKFLNLYRLKGWNEHSSQLISKIKLSLPEISTIVTTFTDTYTKKSDNKLLLLIFLTIINGYIKTLSDNYNLSQQISKPYSDIINQSQLTGIDFVLLDNFFQLQEGENSQVKWWNKTDKSTSLFTSLLKIASSNESSTSSLSSKITTLLSNLVNQTVIFDKESANADQTQLLVASLRVVQTSDGSSNDELVKVWKLLDESISRCVRSPFKYLDSSNENDRVSPLVMTLFEQWKFVDKTTPYDLTSKWFLIFLRYIIIAGESSSAISKLLSTIEISGDASEYLPLSAQPSFSKENPLHGYEDYSYFTLITSASTNKLQNISKIPTSHLDIVASLFRLNQIFADDQLNYNNGLKQSIVEILTKIGNYLFGNSDEVIEFSKSKYWASLFTEKSSNEKKSFISSTLAEIFSQLPNFNTRDFQDITLNQLTEGNDDSVIAASLWALNNDQLLQVVKNGSDLVKSEALSLLLSRRAAIKSSLIAGFLRDDHLSGFANDFILKSQVEYDDVESLLNVISSNTSLLKVFGSLAKDGKIIDQLLAYIQKESNAAIISIVFSSLSEEVLASLSDESLVSELVNTAKTFAIENIKNEDFSVVSFDSYLQILNHPSLQLSSEEKGIVIEYSLTKNNQKYTSEVAKAVQAFGSFDDTIIKTWANKASLYITKGFAELNELPDSFSSFIESYKSLLLKSNLIQSTNKSNLNTLLEVIFTKWSTDESALELSAIVTSVSHKNSLDTNKLLQIIAFNDDNALSKKSSQRSRFLTSLIIWRLFEFDVSKNSTIALQEKFLTFYRGTPNADDLLLYRILERIETRLNSSWIDTVFTWEVLDTLSEEESELVGETKLLEKKKEGFIITLSKRQITNTIKDYTISHAEIPSLSSSGSSNWEKLNSFYESVSSSSSSSKTYDPLFLSLLIINDDELINVNTEEPDALPKVDMRTLIESDLFPFLLMNLSSENEVLVNVTIGILTTILSSLKENSTFKDKHIFELFLSKILFTFKKVDEESGEKVTTKAFSPLVFSMISKISTLLVNPGHMLYEKAFRWVLKSPTLRKNEIPLFNDITVVSATNDDSNNYYKQVSWLLEGINNGIKNKDDTRLLRSKNIYEWFLNLETSPYTSVQLKFLINDFIKQVQNIEDGADILISRYGGLSFLEQQISEKSVDGKILTSAQGKLTNEQELLNLKELGVRYSIIGQGKKRIADWANGDLSNFNKRLHTEE
ncbi:Nucleolar pre-ribosomal-associated protein 1 [Wickerhamomyces ciferrii]|uniref:Nucleolar pre-ribosomal-associated protein 1 n=1 Tax=Wickerhamomyces ciferrii (strain ATCC 14091 / BCRC 22168 / CBS 111 / JCM 3599 / NBRC 0793 / NRRL Y-1031 F-60-10) TaxID=1206466 RepID=K0KUQ9_WICCF|nr:Nucleolar pre-ribosomal-associated protein 1 [Wickerhamomyces ciferrii]CCH45169.1 Nucleolar pre-ribosomal-associated protein 1 [Wickerhamomyces ciferrii]